MLGGIKTPREIIPNASREVSTMTSNSSSRRRRRINALQRIVSTSKPSTPRNRVASGLPHRRRIHWIDRHDRVREQFPNNNNNNNNNNNDPTDNAANRRRIILSDIMGSTSPISRVLDYMERESRRKRERGRRLVAALKECSLCVKECHLIEKKDGDEEDYLNDYVENDIGEGDIELGNLCDDKMKDNDEDAMTVASEEVWETATANISHDPPASSNAESNGDDPQTISTAGDAVTPSSVDVAVPTALQNNMFGSLYQVDDPYEDDDDDNKYSALCIPCAADSVAEASTNTPQSPAPQSTTNTRIVSATCIICLIQYTPNCYVSWSSNKECTHVFHRDCILMWLLKKDNNNDGGDQEGGGALCPCCRREFVLESVLNGDDAGEGGRSDGEGRAGSGVEAASTTVAAIAAAPLYTAPHGGAGTQASILGPAQSPQQRQTTTPTQAARYTNFPGFIGG
mmetsp:Transcript_32449/g.68229  ORF Transcript_32449/g.68229 Transcript_32449/m.68229 type:complete len:456 (-) Transcript_32449:113-1480(-)